MEQTFNQLIIPDINLKQHELMSNLKFSIKEEIAHKVFHDLFNYQEEI